MVIILVQQDCHIPFFYLPVLIHLWYDVAPIHCDCQRSIYYTKVRTRNVLRCVLSRRPSETSSHRIMWLGDGRGEPEGSTRLSFVYIPGVSVSLVLTRGHVIPPPSWSRDEIWYLAGFLPLRHVLCLTRGRKNPWCSPLPAGLSIRGHTCLSFHYAFS